MSVGDPVGRAVCVLGVRLLDLLAVDGDGAVCRAVAQGQGIATENPES